MRTADTAVKGAKHSWPAPCKGTPGNITLRLCVLLCTTVLGAFFNGTLPTHQRCVREPGCRLSASAFGARSDTGAQVSLTGIEIVALPLATWRKSRMKTVT